MEDIYSTTDRSWVSKEFDIYEYFSEFQGLIHKDELKYNTNKHKPSAEKYLKHILSMMETELNPQQESELVNLVQVKEQLRAPGVPIILNVMEIKAGKHFLFQPIPTPDESKILKTVKYRKDDRLPEVYFKFKNDSWAIPQPSSHKPIQDLIPMDEIMINIRVYFPFKHTVGERSRVPVRCSQEISALGFHTLAEIRDHIYCRNDGLVCKESSDNPGNLMTKYAKDVYKSGFFYIGSTFYNDHRHPGNIDYSEVIRKWATDPGKGIGPLHIAKMEDVQMATLTFRLGYPYVYVHQGDCEHLIIFSQANLLTRSNILCSKAYPLTVSMSMQKCSVCNICGIHTSRWITFGHSNIPNEPGYFCESCFKSYNYVGKQKIYTFKAYPLFEFTLEASKFAASALPYGKLKKKYDEKFNKAIKD